MEWGMEHLWNDTDGGKPEVLGEKTVPVPLSPPQISHWLTWYRTRVSSLRGRPLRV